MNVGSRYHQTSSVFFETSSQRPAGTCHRFNVQHRLAFSGKNKSSFCLSFHFFRQRKTQVESDILVPYPVPGMQRCHLLLTWTPSHHSQYCLYLDLDGSLCLLRCGLFCELEEHKSLEPTPESALIFGVRKLKELWNSTFPMTSTKNSISIRLSKASSLDAAGDVIVWWKKEWYTENEKLLIKKKRDEKCLVSQKKEFVGCQKREQYFCTSWQWKEACECNKFWKSAIEEI